MDIDDKNDGAWLADDFESSVSAGLIACFETEIRKAKLPKSLRINDTDLKLMRKIGPFFMGNDRYIISNDVDGRFDFDMVNDKLPVQGTFATRKWSDKGQVGAMDGYIAIFVFNRVSKIPSPMFPVVKGTHYEIAMIVPNNQRIEGEKHYLTVTPDGKIHSADSIGFDSSAGFRSKRIKQSEHEPHVLREREAWLSYALQANADLRFCWSITAKEADARVTLGCTREEVKSLLYARSLPQTETGRKRPIIHLIESHKRRLKGGIEVDVVPFLKGLQTVEIGGTAFTVNPPMVRKPDVSENSQVRYYASK